jgi:hypothetical protein
MSSKELFADIVVGENVIILSDKGNVLDEGTITKVQKGNSKSDMSFSRNYIYVTVDDTEYCFSSAYYIKQYFFNAERYQLALNQKVTSELADVLDKNVSYAMRDLPHTVCDQITAKIKEIEALVAPYIQRDHAQCSIESFQKMWGNRATSEADIIAKFNKDTAWYTSGYEDVIKNLMARNPPDNLVSITSAKKKPQAKKANG